MINALPPRFAQLRLRDLMLLEHLEQLGSLTEAAAQLHVTQSAVTQALQNLEQAFGQPLVERGRRGQRGVRLTRGGAAALQRLRIARQELQAAFAAAGEPEHPQLRVGALPLVMVSPLPDALARLRQRLPQVHVLLSEGTVPVLWRQLEAGELDAIVCRLPERGEQPALPHGVAHRTVGHETMVVVCSRTHPLARRRKPDLAVLREHPWVLPPEGSYTRMGIDAMFMRAGLQTPRPSVTSISFHTNLRLAAQAGLLAMAPRAAAQAMAQVLRLVLLPVPMALQDRDIVLAWRSASAQDPALAALIGSF
jgi:molybdate transport repressor ModE-like protein